MQQLHVPSVTNDPVVTYDIMWEAANRLTSLYVRKINAGGPDDPAVVEIRRIRAQAEAVSTTDLNAQRAATEEFSGRRERMLRGH